MGWRPSTLSKKGPWTSISHHLPHRSAHRIRSRWHNQYDPDIKNRWNTRNGKRHDISAVDTPSLCGAIIDAAGGLPPRGKVVDWGEIVPLVPSATTDTHGPFCPFVSV